jgi:hypothetical protein
VNCNQSEKKGRIFIAVLLFSLLYFFHGPLYSEGINDRVVAYMDTAAITLSELETRYLDTRKVTPDITREEVLNTMINRVLLLREAKKLRLEAPSEDELLKEYIDLKVRTLIRVKEEDVLDFHNKHRDEFEGKDLEDVRDNIETYLVEHQLNEQLKAHISELRRNACVKVQLTPETDSAIK